MGAVFTKPQTVNGERFAAGDPVPEGAFDGRRLAQLVTLRRVAEDDSDHAKLLVEATVEETPSAKAAESETPASSSSPFAPDFEVPAQSEPAPPPTDDGELPFGCEVEDCSRRFSSARGLSNHVGRTHK